MTVNDLIEISTLSSSLILLKLNSDKYEDMDHFINWSFSTLMPKTEKDNEVLNGELANFGNNLIEGLNNLILVYKRFSNKIF